jgi:hypothetical protein
MKRLIPSSGNHTELGGSKFEPIQIDVALFCGYIFD